jgi:hypothetical protein
MVLGLEEGDEVRCSVRLSDFSEPHESVHLVHVPAHVFRKALKPVHQGIRAIFHSVSVRSQPPKQGIEQGEALTIRMAYDVPGEIYEATRNREARSPRLRHFSSEQLVRRTLDAPDYGFGRNAGLGQVARCIAPAFEVIFGGQRDAMGVDHGTFAQHVSL